MEPDSIIKIGSSIISSFFFVDDLVIFNKAKVDQAYLLKGILKPFCDFFGHKINARKSNMYFSKRVTTHLCVHISQIFGFQEVPNLGIYLRVPLLHERVTRNTFNFVVDKVRHKIGMLGNFPLQGGSLWLNQSF